MSNNNVVTEKVLFCVGRQFEVNCNENDLNKNLDEDFKAHQLDKIEIIMHLEDEFGIQISDEEVEQVVFVKDIVKLVSSKQ